MIYWHTYIRSRSTLSFPFPLRDNASQRVIRPRYEQHGSIVPHFTWMLTWILMGTWFQPHRTVLTFNDAHPIAQLYHSAHYSWEDWVKFCFIWGISIGAICTASICSVLVQVFFKCYVLWQVHAGRFCMLAGTARWLLLHAQLNTDQQCYWSSHLQYCILYSMSLKSFQSSSWKFTDWSTTL